MRKRNEVNWKFGAATMLLAATWLGAFAVPVPASERVALVIGNADYPKLGGLRNPANDARAMASKLRNLDFELIGGKAHVNVTRREMLRLLNNLEDRLRPTKEATALVYYSGHGVSADGDNWLVPVDDSEIRYRESVPDYAVSAWKGVVGRLEDRGDGLNILILDACRDNPLPTRRKTKGSLTRGLARVESTTPVNTVVVYAAAPGQVAYDGDGDFSPFTAALLIEMGKPGKDLNKVLGATFDSVRRATSDRQSPWVETQSPDLSFYFVMPSNQGGSSQAAQSHEPLTMALQAKQYNEADESASRKTVTEQAARDLVHDREFRDCPQCPRMVVVPAGTYEMGSPSGEGADDEKHRHRVTISAPIAIGVFEVRRGEFTRFLEETSRTGGSACWHYDGVEIREGGGPTDPGFVQGENEPMVCVSWMDAQAYVDWLSRKTRKKYRLLSESEWEYAARGGTVTPRYWEESETGQCRNANGADAALKSRYADWFDLTESCDDGHVHTSETGRYGPNGFGLFDMLGNAREWVEDCWHRDYADAPPDGSAWTEGGSCSLRVLRGGSWLDGPGGVRSSTRDKGTTRIRFSANGFRVARALD